MMPRLPLTHPLHLAIGMTLWSLWFVAFYGGLSVACAVAPPDPLHGAFTAINAGLALLTLATVGLLAWLAWRAWQVARSTRGRARYLARLSAGLYAFAAIGALYMGLPVIALPPCV
jgi:hypothetical protein